MSERAANENRVSALTSAQADAEMRGDQRCQFRLFKADWVSFTSTQFGGGDWRWQFCSPSGEILAECGGYRSEAKCRASVLRLQNEAAYATLA